MRVESDTQSVPLTRPVMRLSAMQFKLSPSFEHDKLNSPSHDDLVDVLEDIWTKCVLDQAGHLLSRPHGEIAAMSLLTTYFEAHESLVTGVSSDGKSKRFFVDGFCKVFSTDQSGIEDAAVEIYRYIRCGLAHEANVRAKVLYSSTPSKAFLLTYPKNADGSLATDAGVTSIVVNPHRFYEVIRDHFTRYISELRQDATSDLSNKFRARVYELWKIGEDELVIGMSESQFCGDA